MSTATPRFRRFPFDPARLPFFYGWPVLVAGTLGMIASAPGQTVGVSVFTDYLISALAIERSALSIAYLIGTLAGAATLARTGFLYDRFGARLVATASACLLAVTLILLTALPTMAAALGHNVVRTVAATSVLFWMLRYSGQGMLSLASRNMVMEWFDRRRGLANAVMGMSLAFGFSAAPRFFEALIGPAGDWIGAWHTIAAIVTVFALFALIVFRDKPEDHGLVPDGPLATRAVRVHAEAISGNDFNARQARRTYTFWIFAAVLALCGLLLTAYTFHIISIFDDAGMGRAVAVSVFVPAAIVAVVVEIFGSWLSDFVKLKYLAIAQLVGCIILSLSLAAPGGVAYVGVVVGHGIMQGLFGVVSNVGWPRFFGRKHLGSIAGFATSVTVLGTAIGPAFFSFARDLTGRYSAAALVTGVCAVALGVLAIKADRPTHPLADEAAAAN